MIENQIRDRIKYARRIQRAILPPKIFCRILFPNVLSSNCPKILSAAISSWFSGINNRLIIAVANCPGHGVPDAFMSILGMAYPNEFVN